MIEIHSFDTLLKEANKHPYYVIPGLLPIGLTTLRGPKKIGKSCLMLKLAIDASQGNPVFGQYPCEAKRVYFYGYRKDIGPASIQDRCTDLGLPTTAYDWGKRLFNCKDGTGLEIELGKTFNLKHIANVIEKHKTQIVIIDPADRLLNNSNIIASLNHLAWENGVSIILTTTKTMSDNGLWETSCISEVDWSLSGNKEQLLLHRKGGPDETPITLSIKFSKTYTEVLEGWGRKPITITAVQEGSQIHG